MTSRIKTSEKTYITNPTHNPSKNDYVWEGDINKFDFNDDGLKQKDNYEKLKKSFNKNKIYFDYVWMKRYNSNDDKKQTLVTFVVKCKDINIFWRKYEGNVAGGGTNCLIFNGDKMKLSKWLKMDSKLQKKYLKDCGLVDLKKKNVKTDDNDLDND